MQDQSIAACCWKSYNSYSDQERCIRLIEEAFGGVQLHQVSDDTTKKERLIARVHAFLEEPNSSTAAKVICPLLSLDHIITRSHIVTSQLPVQVYSYFFGILLIVTVAVTIVSTHESFRVQSSLTNHTEYENETNPKKLLHFTTQPHLSLVVSQTHQYKQLPFHA